MKRMTGAMLAAAVSLTLGCSVLVPKETLYLESAQDRATQEDVKKKLGAPTFTATTVADEPVWVYQIYWQDPSNQNSWGAPGTWCDEYVLTFDRKGVLRRWTHQSEGHAGELSPTYCVKDGFKPAS